VVAGLFIVDLVTGDDTVLVTLYLVGPLLAAVATGTRATATVAALAVVLGTVGILVDGDVIGQDAIRFSTIVSGSALAVWIAGLRARLQIANSELDEAIGLLDVVFAHAPVGLALLDADLRYVRVNDRLAEINGLPAPDHLGRTIAEVLPDLGPEVMEDVARVARTGTPLIEVEVTGSTPARPGAVRHWLASYWPVRRDPDGPPIGVGLVVIEVTDRRAAERALREQTDRYEALLHALSDAGEGLVVLEPDGRCVYANSAFEQLSGYAFPELASLETVLDLVVEYDDSELRERVLHQMAEGDVQPGQPLTLRRRDGAWVDLEMGGTPLEVEGRRQLVVVVRDVTARRQAEAERERLLARAALLAEASELFDRSLDEEITLRRVAQLCVREIAETCVILLGEGLRLRGVVAAARDEDRERELLTAVEGEPLERGPLVDVLRGGNGLVTATPAGLGTARSVIVPLRARGRNHGVLAAGFDDLADASDEEALALFRDLARRAALAIDNARLYAERDRVARTLQQSLLPGALPDVPGVELAGRYRAAGAGNEVGGDFYDCFAIRDGEWALVIGDVCGKGAEAATLTALARYTIRAAAQHTADPRAVLGELNEALLRHRLGYRFCTVLYASLIPRGDSVSASLATGGHPLPLVLRAGGEVETVGAPGSLLGILEDPDITQRSVELRPGDALVLVTDGVTEATPADRASGPQGLTSLLAGCAGANAAAIAEAVEHEAVSSQGGSARDDVAVLVARVEAGPPGEPFASGAVGVAAAS
jgi:PAS domain S-box-containing protein